MKKLIFFTIFLAAFALSASAKSVGVYCFFVNDKSNIYEDENVQLVGTYTNKRIDICIINKTKKIIYIDKANSFIYLNGTPIPLFSNAVKTTGVTDTNGLSVNLGGIARGLGMNGPLTTGLGAINVGGSTSVQNSTTIYEQRILAIAPLSTEILYSIGDLRNKFTRGLVYIGEKPSFRDISAGEHGYFLNTTTGKREKFKKGDSQHYHQNTSPLVVMSAITYSTNEQFTESSLITISHHISDIVIDSKKGARDNKRATDAYLPFCAPYFAKGMDCIRFLSGRNVGVPIAAYVTIMVGIAGATTAIVAVCVAA